jgi:hypothetical protein
VTVSLPPRRRAQADLNAVLAVTGSIQLRRRAPSVDIRMAGRQVRAKQHVLNRDRGIRTTVDPEVAEGAYAQLPAWSHREQHLTLVQMAATAWFPEQIHRQVSAVTLQKFAVVVAGRADDATGRNCYRPYSQVAIDMGVSEETVRACWRALERLGLAVQVQASVCFPYDERMRIWRLERSKQRGLTPVYALVVPAAYARALVTGEHPADLIAADQVAEPVTPAQSLCAALSKLRSTDPRPSPVAAPEPLSVAAQDAAEVSPGPEEAQSAPAPVDNSRRNPFGKLANVDILALPLGRDRCTFSAAIALVAEVPHGVKSTASRAHNRDDGSAGHPGGSTSRRAPRKRCTGREGWFGAHRDIAVHLTRRVLWLRGVAPGRIAPQLKRFTVAGHDKVWRPDDFVTAFDGINRRQGRYSPGANMASQSRDDRARVESASAGAVRSPQGLLKWYLDQLDPVNDHPRFELDAVNDVIRSSWISRREAAAVETAARAEAGHDHVARLRQLAGLPAETAPRNRRATK